MGIGNPGNAGGGKGLAGEIKADERKYMKSLTAISESIHDFAY